MTDSPSERQPDPAGYNLELTDNHEWRVTCLVDGRTLGTFPDRGEAVDSAIADVAAPSP